MRPVLALIFAATTWATTCATPLPCVVLAPDLTVVLAEALEDQVPGDESGDLRPVRMRLRAIFYGRPPRDEFIWYAWPTEEIHRGDLFYFEESPKSNFRAQVCGVSGRYSKSFHGERAKHFRELAAGKHNRTSFRLDARDAHSTGLPGVAATLSGAPGTFVETTGPEGMAEWKNIPAGSYTLALEKPGYSPESISDSLAPVNLPQGACSSRHVEMRSRFSIFGVIRTDDGKPAAGAEVRIERLFESTDARTTVAADGTFRFAHVEPDEYILVAGDGHDQRSPYPATYYPGVPRRELATRIAVGPD